MEIRSNFDEMNKMIFVLITGVSNISAFSQRYSKSNPQVITLHFQNAYSVQTGKNKSSPWQPGFVKELQRKKIMNLPAEKLQPMNAQ
jgi:hypothetical protein